MYITDIHRLDMVHILYIMLNFDEVYISDIPPAVSIATWYIYAYMHAYERMLVTLSASGAKPCVQNGVSGIYTDAVFKLLVQNEAEIWTILSSKAYYSSQVSRVCAAAL